MAKGVSLNCVAKTFDSIVKPSFDVTWVFSRKSQANTLAINNKFQGSEVEREHTCSTGKGAWHRKLFLFRAFLL